MSSSPRIRKVAGGFRRIRVGEHPALAVPRGVERRIVRSIPPLLVVLLLLGVGIFRDYGIHWDHEANRNYGLGTLGSYYALIGLDVPADLEAAGRQVHFRHRLLRGPAVETLLALVERGFTSGDSREVAFARHLATFVVFCIGVGFFQWLVTLHFGSWKLGLLGAVCLVLTPRIFAHAFYDSVDIGFLAAFVVSMTTLVRFLDRRNAANAVAHAVACGVLVGTRSVGAFVPALTVGFALVEALRAHPRETALRRGLSLLALYAAVLGVVVVGLWPALWTNPVAVLVEAVGLATRTGWKLPVLYLGEQIPGSRVPWHYNFVWMAITIPIPYTLAFLVGLPVALGRLLARRGSWRLRRNELLFLLWLFVPLLAPIALRSTLYDGWRHHYFVYPAFLLLALSGARSVARLARRRLASRPRLALAVGSAALAGALVPPAAFMLRNHPHQNVYFNALAGDTWRGRFDLDYWGLSYRQGLEFILRTDPGRAIPIAGEDLPVGFNRGILPPRDRSRLRYVDVDEAKYFLTNFRWHPQGHRYDDEVYSVSVDGRKIMVVYRLRP